jgi:uncharacterized membrane protein
MNALITQLKVRPRLMIAFAAGVVVATLAPGHLQVVTRALLGWNAGVWLYLVLIVWMMTNADTGHLRRVALAHAEGAAIVLGVAIAAVAASVAAIILELSTANAGGAGFALRHVLFALVTVAGSWLLLPTLFALSYASLFYRSSHGSGHGLEFPGHDETTHPDYWEFMYFSFTIAVASQTADVAISTRSMRKLVLLQAVLSFAFNTTILALTINIAAGLFAAR